MTEQQKIRVVTYVLDDDREDLEAIRPQLAQVCGADLGLYTDIQDFVRAIEQGCHICIIDYRLNAAIDGIEVGRIVLQKNPRAYLIMLSGMDDRATVIHALNTGFRYYIDKNREGFVKELTSYVEKKLEDIREDIMQAEREKEAQAARVLFLNKYEKKWGYAQ